MFLKVKAGRRELSLRRVLSAGPGCLLLAKVENIWARIIRFSRFFNWKLLSPNLFQTKSRVGASGFSEKFSEVYGGYGKAVPLRPTGFQSATPRRAGAPRRRKSGQVTGLFRLVQVCGKAGQNAFFKNSPQKNQGGSRHFETFFYELYE